MANNTREELSFKVPVFKGDAESRDETEAFIMRIEACIARIQDAPEGATAAQLAAVSKKKADTLQMGFIDGAQRWCKNWKKKNQAQASDYEALLAAFKARFLEPEKMTDVNAITANLKQGKTESVQAFWDRCEEAAYLVLNYEGTIPAIRDHANFRVAVERLLANTFTAGVSPAIKESIAELADKDVNEFLEAAKKIEKAHKLGVKDKSKPQKSDGQSHKPKNGNGNGKKVHEIQEDEDKEVEEVDQQEEPIDEFRRTNGRGRGRPRGRGNGNNFQRYRNGSYNNNNSRNGNGFRNRRQMDFNCDVCGEYGHGARYCPLVQKVREQRMRYQNNASIDKFRPQPQPQQQQQQNRQMEEIFKEMEGNWPDFQ